MAASEQTADDLTMPHLLHAVVIELHSRRVRIVGSIPYPDEASMLHTVRQFTYATDGVLAELRVLVCDRDRKWSTDVQHLTTIVQRGLQSGPNPVGRLSDITESAASSCRRRTRILATCDTLQPYRRQPSSS
jgi:hypothetical protein